MLRKRLTAFATAIALCLTGAALVPASSMALDPILFVRGWNGSASNWSTMKARFEKDGYPPSHLLAYNYNTSTSNKTTGETEVKARVDQLLASTGATKVDILAHSMGSLNSRWYLKFVPGAQEKVDDWVSFGGPNHGTSLANVCFSTTCVEMRIGSKFLTELNAGEETPGAVNYGTWWSTCDAFINPEESVILSGATNTNVGCVSHLGLVSNEAIYKQVREFIK